MGDWMYNDMALVDVVVKRYCMYLSMAVQKLHGNERREKKGNENLCMHRIPSKLLAQLFQNNLPKIAPTGYYF